MVQHGTRGVKKIMCLAIHTPWLRNIPVMSSLAQGKLSPQRLWGHGFRTVMVNPSTSSAFPEVGLRVRVKALGSSQPKWVCKAKKTLWFLPFPCDTLSSFPVSSILRCCNPYDRRFRLAPSGRRSCFKRVAKPGSQQVQNNNPFTKAQNFTNYRALSHSSFH